MPYSCSSIEDLSELLFDVVTHNLVFYYERGTGGQDDIFRLQVYDYNSILQFECDIDGIFGESLCLDVTGPDNDGKHHLRVSSTETFQLPSSYFQKEIDFSKPYASVKVEKSDLDDNFNFVGVEDIRYDSVATQFIPLKNHRYSLKQCRIYLSRRDNILEIQCACVPPNCGSTPNPCYTCVITTV